MKINTLLHKNAQLPKLLSAIYDPPKQIYLHGTEIPATMPLLAVVGARKATPYGSTMTQQIISELRGYNIGIVSGLALGIDAVAHRSALDAQLYTLAVLPSGLKTIYPRTNSMLAQRIAKEGGTLISEYNHLENPRKHYFLQRNRIIAGLTRATLVIEAATRSGALTTAHCALAEGREVMAVPGSVLSPQSTGTNSLIKAGAHVITSGKDILHILGIAEHLSSPKYMPQNKEEALVLAALETGYTHESELYNAAKLPYPLFAQTLIQLELSGHIQEIGGNNYILR